MNAAAINQHNKGVLEVRVRKVPTASRAPGSSESAARIKIVIADHSELYREMFRMVVEAYPRLGGFEHRRRRLPDPERSELEAPRLGADGP